MGKRGWEKAEKMRDRGIRLELESFCAAALRCCCVWCGVMLMLLCVVRRHAESRSKAAAPAASLFKECIARVFVSSIRRGELGAVLC